MHPIQIISYYPTHALLDQIITNGYKKANLFIDLKNCAQTLYQKHCIDQLLENSSKSRYMDSSIFQSVLAFLSFHKLYSIKRKIDFNYFIFFEVGQSYYHKNIHNKYKISRQIDDLYGLDSGKIDEFFTLVRNNYLLIEKVLNKVPNIFVIKMENLDADFVPYYMIKNNLVESNNETANIIYSNDHDLRQSLLNENCYIFSKANKVKRIIKKNEAIKNELKLECEISDEYLPLIMSVLGDNGDDVYGIKGIGGKTILKIFPQLNSLIGGSMDILYDNVINNRPIFNMKSKEVLDKNIKKILEEEEKNNTITKNLKLVSFELLSKEIEFSKNTEMLQKKEQIKNILSQDKISKRPIIKALEMNGVFIYTDDFDVLYYGTSLYDPD